jgi:hypothetical protein
VTVDAVYWTVDRCKHASHHRGCCRPSKQIPGSCNNEKYDRTVQRGDAASGGFENGIDFWADFDWAFEQLRFREQRGIRAYELRGPDYQNYPAISWHECAERLAPGLPLGVLKADAKKGEESLAFILERRRVRRRESTA